MKGHGKGYDGKGYGEEAGVPSDLGSHDCHRLLQWKDGGCVIMSKVKGPSSGLSCKVTGCGLKSQIINSIGG